MKDQRLFHITRVVPLLAVLICLGGCGIPNSMHVRMGGEPRYQDDDVLFRTTYYFRVFDDCDDGSTATAKKRIQNDSLYRFKMTGKAKSYVDKVRFESGTLQAWQIDPLGASVEFDKESGKPYFVSQQKREEVLKQNSYYTEISRLRAMLERFKCGEANLSADVTRQCAIINTKLEENLQLIGPGGTANLGYVVSLSAVKILDDIRASMKQESDAQAEAFKTLQGQIGTVIRTIKSAPNDTLLTAALDEATRLLEQSAENSANLSAFTLDPNGNNDDAKDKTALLSAIKTLGDLRVRLTLPGSSFSPVAMADTKQITCNSGMPARRGFQILGPEGWRTFDQDERLILAMSTSGKPLLDALRDLSSRAMAQKSEGLSKDETLSGQLALAQARAKLAEVKLDKPDELAVALEAVVKAFNK